MVMGVKQFERLFREAASLGIDKSDILYWLKPRQSKW